MSIFRIVALLALSMMAPSVAAQTGGGPVQVLNAPPVPTPIDRAFAGRIELDVDATDVRHQIFVVHERVPVQGKGEMTLLYPRWDQGSHGPSLTVTDLAGLRITANGHPVEWRRDPIQPHGFHLTIPPNSSSLDIAFQLIAGADLLTPDIVSVPWQRLILYPAGWYARNIPVAASVTLPTGLTAFTSLEREPGTGSDAALRFQAVTMERLIDAPVLAGRYTARIPLGPEGDGPVSLDVVALRPDDLMVPPQRLEELRRLVTQTRLVFGPPPYRRYEILARLSDDGSSGGTEHRASSENFLGSSHFRGWTDELNYRDLIAHETVHAWNGLYRIPADLWAPTPNVPVGDSLLWVYEGQTEFWGRILATRAGQLTIPELRDRLAIDAAEMANRPGRSWRSLSDDVNYPSFMLQQRVPWRDWQRRRDYYSEGVLLWLDIDAELRARSRGRRGIDDFAHLFYAGATPDAPARTYTFDDLCHALNATAPGDWAAFLRRWLDAHDELDPTIGLQRHGWRLAYTETPTKTFRQHEQDEGVVDLSYSIGLKVADSGAVRAVSWDGPAFGAGMRPGVKIVAVNGQPFSPALLLLAVRDALRTPIVLTVEQDGGQTTRPIDYRGTLRYPYLERIVSQPETLGRLATARPKR